jgi:uncharacterized protein
MVYVDTSALVPLFIHEPSSDAIIDWLASSGEPLAISEWTLVEFASAAAIKRRAGHVTVNLAKEATAHMYEFARKHCTVAVPARESFRRAVELVGELKLRAGDALHLAIAESLHAQAILCLDHSMIEAAKVLGVPAAKI